MRRVAEQKQYGDRVHPRWAEGYRICSLPALERACGGKAVGALAFLDEEAAVEDVDVAAALLHDLTDGQSDAITFAVEDL